MNDATLQSSMVAAIGASIAGARAVGKPDPSDDDLYFDLSDAGFAATDIHTLLPRLKAVALDCLTAAAELAALALLLAGSGIWAGILRGVI